MTVDTHHERHCIMCVCEMRISVAEWCKIQRFLLFLFAEIKIHTVQMRQSPKARMKENEFIRICTVQVWCVWKSFSYFPTLFHTWIHKCLDMSFKCYTIAKLTYQNVDACMQSNRMNWNANKLRKIKMDMGSGVSELGSKNRREKNWSKN